MERDSRKDLIISGLLALLVHASLAVFTWNLTNDRVPRFEPARLADAMTIDLVARRPAVVVTNRTGEAAQPRRDQSRPRSNRQDAVRTHETRQPETSDQSPPPESKEDTLFSHGEISPAPPLRPESAALSDGGSGQQFRGSGSGLETASLPGFVESRPPAYGHRQDPEYPEFARRRGYQGTALLRVRVLEDGRVATVQIKESSGYQILDGTATKAVWTWQFAPALADGRPVASWVLVPITFRLQ
ncbi:MAG TPA: energy transducer TonB [Syntrophobacteria bacterium]|nr:energy transducer TonB [Syntrophobacteria bacterium]